MFKKSDFGADSLWSGMISAGVINRGNSLQHRQHVTFMAIPVNYQQDVLVHCTGIKLMGRLGK